MPFSSKAQWKKCFALKDPNWDCRKWARETGPKGKRFSNLPFKVSKKEVVRTHIDAEHSGVILALPVNDALAEVIMAIPGVNVPRDELHITLCFLGSVEDNEPIKDTLIGFVDGLATQSPLKGTVNGFGRFYTDEDGTNPVYVCPDLPALPEFRQNIIKALSIYPVNIRKDHGYNPHITVAYVPLDAETPEIKIDTPAIFDTVCLAWGSEWYTVKLGNGQTSQLDRLRASFKAAKPRNYGAKAGQVISGNLARGGDGKFTSAGNAKAAPAKPKANEGASSGAASSGAAQSKPGPSPSKRKRSKLKRRKNETEQQYNARVQEQEQEAAQQEQEAARDKQANREAIYNNLGLAEDSQAALTALFEGGDNTDDGGLVALGLAEQNDDGTYRLTPAGRAFARSAEKGDSAAARDKLGAAKQQARKKTERAAAKDARAKASAERKKVLTERKRLRLRRAAERARKKKDDELARSYDDELAQLDKTVAIYKSASGVKRWITFTTTAYQDRDGQWITRKGIQNAVAIANKTGFRGTLRFWHIKNLDFGECDTQIALGDGRVLIEAGTFYSPEHALIVEKAVAAGYKVSPGFMHPIEETKEFNFPFIFERSFLPANVASNTLTAMPYVGEMK